MGEQKGYVFLVGAGPGDVRLLTLKGEQVIKEADVILYDRLVNPLLLELAKPEAELVYCGKLPDRHLLRQESINELLVAYSQAGKRVVRLKGGDPSVFGRVGEEAQALEQAGIRYEIVPGITAGIGAATYVGVPVTHRDHGASFAMVTGHDKSDNGRPLLDWRGLATIDTIAFYMGVKNLPYICEQLLAHGKPGQTPVLLIQWGTLGKQKVLEGTIATISAEASRVGFSNPAITLIGDVAKLRTKESWFERQPLFGTHLLFARTGSGKSEIAAGLTELGATVFEYPRFQTIWETAPVPSFAEFQEIIFHSPASVNWFFAKLKEQRIDIRSLTADLYGASGKSVKAIESYACLAYPVTKLTRHQQGKRLVIGDERVEKRQLPDYGSYQFCRSHRETVVAQSHMTCRRLLEEDRLDTIVFPSAEAVRVVTEEIKVCSETPASLSSRAAVICFGPASANEARRLGYEIRETLQEPTREALREAVMKAHFAKGRV
ncbi:uroporphyrinogen-III C-methyltransferase [Halalkalibacter oceani]|uniref:uroporphyrinogen-III C-methyltransferase n=1 Tax=Halalkalibacter oceani TaxID=1653776 RepID=UPI003394ED5F